MFKPTKPFKDRITSYPNEPSLRIGRSVPKNAVNLAYYYNPIATEAEKVLTAEAPRNTIDHRVEEAYRYLFEQATDDDDLFPKSIWYEDEEGYKGYLGRMYVHWYPKSHVNTKYVTQQKEVIVTDKSNLIKMIGYADENGYSGSLYLDVADFEVSKSVKVSTTEVLDREILNHELNYYEIFGKYIDPSDLDRWVKEPDLTQSSLWPSEIYVEEDYTVANGGNQTVQNFVDGFKNPYDMALGVLQFDSLHYEQVYSTSPKDGTITSPKSIHALFSTKKEKGPFEESSLEDALDLFHSYYETTYNSRTDSYDTTQIEYFLKMADRYCENKNASAFYEIRNAMQEKKKDISIYLDYIKQVAEDSTNSESDVWWECEYKYVISTRGQEGTYQYNVTVNYTGTLKKTITKEKEIPAEYKALCSFTGLVRKVWYTYDGMAYYRGAVTKGNGIGNLNPELNNEILMFSDDNGYLRRPVQITDENGITSTKNFYRIESDYIYLTDVFKNNTPCFYKYPLKKPIYDYRGPDDYGFYEGNAVKIYTSTLKDIPSDYQYNMKLYPDKLETVDRITDDFQLTQITRPVQYRAELFTSFISSSIDTFQVIYNAFHANSEEDNIALENGVTEEIYNYPFMIKDVDFFLEPVDVRARVNKIKLPEPRVIPDNRRYVSFSYTITAERKKDGKSFTTVPRMASILNKDYAVPSEYNKFEERGMIISPVINGLYASPFDLVLNDQATANTEPIVTTKDTDFIFFATIHGISDIDRGAINLKCNPDGSGLITAETTLETGFLDVVRNTYTRKLCLDNPYLIENGKIYPGFQVKCMDSRHIKVNAPREDGLLDSWYPMIQFGHYSQILDQYGTHIKVCYTMPEYDTQHYSTIYKQPCVDVLREKVKVINSHMVKTKCFPLFIKDINQDTNTFIFQDKIFRVYKQECTWKEANDFCRSIGGYLAMPKTPELVNFIINIATQYQLNGLWLGATDEETEGVWKWVDGTLMTYSNWNTGEPNNLGGNEHYLETYTSSIDGKWNDLPATTTVSGFICEFDKFSTIKLYKQVEDELFLLTIKDVSFSDGIILTEDTISENDCIVASYTYIEENYVYRGYWRNRDDFARIDLNPNIYHTYSDLNYIPAQLSATKNLFNKVIYFFLRPTVEYEVDASNDSLIYDLENDEDIGNVLLENKETLYHQIDNNQPESDHDIYIGSVYIRQNTSLHSTILMDARTRGGGIQNEISDSLRKELEPESDYYLDIGYYDGEPYQENGVIIVRLDNRLLKEFGGRFTEDDIEAKVKRWLGFGIYPIIEYVDSYTKQDMPQYHLYVEDSYTNVIDCTPEILVECVKI